MLFTDENVRSVTPTDEARGPFDGFQLKRKEEDARQSAPILKLKQNPRVLCRLRAALL